MCLENEEDIPGDVLGALVKERTSKKDCADHVSWFGVPWWERGCVLAISGSVDKSEGKLIVIHDWVCNAWSKTNAGFRLTASSPITGYDRYNTRIPLSIPYPDSNTLICTTHQFKFVNEFHFLSQL